MSTPMDVGYDPARIESQWSHAWLTREAFVADAESDKPGWAIMLPPPNVTGALHMGHALGNTLQDVLIRFHRMDGFEVLWLPGTDHAGIATQSVVERHLTGRGSDRREIGREAFVKEVWDWKEKYGNRIVSQMKRMGCSLDWSRERFTLDDGLSRAVREVFVSLWEQGLIYREDRLVNWDPAGQTVLSDLEVEQEEEEGSLWHIAYPVKDSKDTLIVATTRPETLLGDTAVAIHPDDTRYAHLHGREVVLPLTGRAIPIITDPEAADMEFGSGAVKITPAHDFNDFETGRRNSLPSITVLDLDGRINENAPEVYRGLDRFEARKRIVADLEAEGLLVKTEPHRLALGRSQRTGVIVEPLSVGEQWFVKAAPLAAPAIDAVRDGRIEIVPEQWESTYFHWMENIRDWCISRQLWWGHRIPAWYCRDCSGVTVSREDPAACRHCASSNIQQDEDVLDTWFSSALWPFSTLGWPDQTSDLKKFYPSAVLETGFDILFFWVARMIMMGQHFMGDVPFRTVFLHAMVRDRHGKKMSKSIGNVIDPVHLIEGVRPQDLLPEEQKTYEQLFRDFPEGIEPQGADALRLTLAIYAAAGRDIKLDVRRVEGYRAFLNKLWNASRFASMHLTGISGPATEPEGQSLSSTDRWILSRLRETVETVRRSISTFRFNEAAQCIYDFTWHDLCDWYVEFAKPILHDDSQPERQLATRETLRWTLDQVLRLLHPICPFITEDIWDRLALKTRDDQLLCHAPFPDHEDMPHWPEDAEAIERLRAVITAIRRVRSENDIPPSAPLPRILVSCDDTVTEAALRTNERLVLRLAKASALDFVNADAELPQLAATTVQSGARLVIPFEGLIDVEAERERLGRELARVEEDIDFFERKLSNPRFVERAPSDVVDKDRARLEELRSAREELHAGVQRLD